MKPPKFLTLLMSQIFSGPGKKPDAAMVDQARAKLLKNPNYDASARHHGNRRRLAMHRRSCLQAYAHKRRLAAEGIGRNTIAGIPAR